ncbi:MAG: sigma-54-dependent transcriptional regulator [Aquificaceae bacterium]
MKGSVLIVDDEKSIRESLKNLLQDEGYSVKVAESLEIARKLIKSEYSHVVLLDLWMPDGSGLDFIKDIKNYLPDASIVIITAHGKVEDAVRAIKDGAYDFLEKPFPLQKLLLTVDRAIHEVIKKRESPKEEEEMVGRSKPILEVKEVIRKVARTNINVLILGESGTGKELVAKYIHKLSDRGEFPFVDLNCASFPEDLIEAELFGYEKGAFTSAMTRRQGKLELAHGGTLFLDEIGDMSPVAQAKLLRVLETKRFTRLGGNQVIESDFRVISASNKDLMEEIRKGKFREDLYYRISAFTIKLPLLRERGEDVLLLAEYFLNKFAREYRKPAKYLTEDTKSLLMSYEWRGNVRELKNLMERIVILSTSEKISADDIRSLDISIKNNYDRLFVESDLKRAKQEFERLFIEEKLKEYSYDLRKVSEVINIDISNLYRKVKQYGIDIKSKGGVYPP